MKKILFLFAFLALTYSAVFASSTTFSFTYSVKSTGQGTVYASTEDEFNPTHQTEINNKTGSFSVTSTSTQSTAYQDIFLDALPNQGYGFVQWRKVDANGNNIGTNPVGTTRKSKSTEQLSNTASNNVFYYQADFGETMVSVGTGEPSKVQVYIDKEINAVGDVVTLTAVTSDNYNIVWTKDGQTVSTDNPLTVTVTEKAHYVATTSVTSKQADGYYRIRSANPNSPNDYVRLADNWFDMTTIVGSATSLQVNKPSRIAVANNVLARDLKITQTPFDDPSSIVYVKNASSNEYYIYAQGTHVKELMTGTHHGSNTGDINYSGTNIKILKAGDICSMSAKVSMSSYDLGNFFFNNNNHVFNITYTNASYNTNWYLEPIDTEDNYFIPKFSLAANGKYYATMRLPFPCKVMGTDLKAYSVTAYPASDDAMATMTEFAAGQTIPAGLPVVIESNSNIPANNVLMPDGDPSNYISSSVASGGTTTGISTALYNNYGKHAHDSHDDQPATGDGVGYFNVAYSGSTTLYKLGVQDDKVGFFTAVASGATIYGNEAYSTQPCALFEKQSTPLAEILASGENGVEYTVSDDLAVADYAEYANYAFVTDGNNNWIKVEADDEVFAQIYNKDVIKGKTLTGTLSNIELNPVLTVTTAPEEGNATVNFSIEELDLTSTFAPKVNQVVDVTGWWNEHDGALRAYSPEAGIQGQSLTLDTSWGASSNTLQNGKRYQIRCAINIKEAWHTPSGIAPKDYNYDFQNYIGYALRMPDAPTAIETLAGDGNEIVNVYNVQGQLLRQNVKASEATSGLGRGIYIVGNKKVIVK